MRCLTNSIRRWLVVLALGPCLSAVVGCGDSKPTRGPTGAVSGKVTLNGKPLPAGCTIVFTHQEKSVPATAPIGSDGSYSLSSVVAGAQKVSFNAPAKAAAAAPDPSNPEAYKAFMMGKGAKSTAEDKPSFPKRFMSPDESGLTFTVQEGPNTYDVDLKE